MRVLWVDDRDFTKWVRRGLEEDGHTFERARDLTEAEMIVATQPDCICIDGCMPHPRQYDSEVTLPHCPSNFDVGMLYAEKLVNRDPKMENKIILMADLGEASYKTDLTKRLGAKGRVIPQDDLDFMEKLRKQISIIASEMPH